MSSSEVFSIRQLGPPDTALLNELSATFGEAFEEPYTYISSRPGEVYLKRLLSSECFIALVALIGESVAGGIAAYELRKFEQERSEIYLYDLAVSAPHRRRGIASALIDELKKIAAARGACTIFVQADIGDDPAIALYSKLGTRETVLHFDIAVAVSEDD